MISLQDLFVDTIWKAIWYIGKGMLRLPAQKCVEVCNHSPTGGKCRTSYPGPLPPSDLLQPPEAIEDLDASPALFALTIGINTYQYASTRLPNLTGCVADADAIVEYLTNQLRVPEDHIKSLRNSDATRANIIQSIVDLSENPDIKRDDAILIFYAGHGSEAVAPEGWPARGSMVQMLLPYDFSPTTSSEPERQGLHDITFGALLSRLAERKGNNITVILDSCHSGSGARTFAIEPSSLAFNVRCAELHEDYRILSSVDQELRQQIGGSRKANDVEPITSGLHSHVLLAGTSAKGYAMENTATKRGVFTVALLGLLKRDSPDTISYKEAIGRLPDLPNQYPQCEGYNQDRAFFNGKAPKAVRMLFRVLKQKGTLILEAGEAQGLAAGAKFDLYKDKDTGSALYGHTSIKIPPRACTSILLPPKFPDGEKPKMSEVPNTLWALQTHVGDNASKISVALPPDQAFVPLIRRVVASMDEQRPTKRNIELVDLNQPHELRLRIAPSGNVIFDINHEEVNGFGVQSIVHSVPTDDDERLFLILSRAADFHYHLRRSNKESSLAPDVSLKAYSLHQRRIKNEDVWLPVNVEENMNVNNVMTVDVNLQGSYGFSLTNSTGDPLYVWAFLFEMVDLEIRTIYRPNYAKSKDGELIPTSDPSIPPHGKLTIGYGDGGAARQGFIISDEDLDVEVSYLKVFITTRPVDLSYIAQPSPFTEKRKSYSWVDTPKNLWDALMMAIVVKRDVD